jgi:ferredoxin
MDSLMAMIITNDCINCGACASECPVDAIYEPGERTKLNENDVNSISNDHYFIVAEICTNCLGLNQINCIAICPMDAIKESIVE